MLIVFNLLLFSFGLNLHHIPNSSICRGIVSHCVMHLISCLLSTQQSSFIYNYQKIELFGISSSKVIITKPQCAKCCHFQMINVLVAHIWSIQLQCYRGNDIMACKVLGLRIHDGEGTKANSLVLNPLTSCCDVMDIFFTTLL